MLDGGLCRWENREQADHTTGGQAIGPEKHPATSYGKSRCKVTTAMDTTAWVPTTIRAMAPASAHHSHPRTFHRNRSAYENVSRSGTPAGAMIPSPSSNNATAITAASPLGATCMDHAQRASWPTSNASVP